MGEYGTYKGEQIKLGTCEDMFYLRADQRERVQYRSGNVDVMNPEHIKELRFRFPWPDEDSVEPGAFENYHRSMGVSVKWSQPLEHEHGSVQFVANVGMNLCIPCPLGPNAKTDIVVHKNGFAGDVQLVQTAWRDGEWRVICTCGACGCAFNIPRWAAEELAVAVRSHADYLERQAKISNRTDGAVAWHHAVADRILAGYKIEEGAQTTERSAAQDIALLAQLGARTLRELRMENPTVARAYVFWSDCNDAARSLGLKTGG